MESTPPSTPPYDHPVLVRQSAHPGSPEKAHKTPTKRRAGEWTKIEAPKKPRTARRPPSVKWMGEVECTRDSFSTASKRAAIVGASEKSFFKHLASSEDSGPFKLLYVMQDVTAPFGLKAGFKEDGPKQLTISLEGDDKQCDFFNACDDMWARECGGTDCIQKKSIYEGKKFGDEEGTRKLVSLRLKVDENTSNTDLQGCCDIKEVAVHPLFWKNSKKYGVSYDIVRLGM